MATPLVDTVETFSAPIESVIIALGQGIAQAQQALDLNSISTQEKIDTDPVLSQYGLQATWYQFPTVNMQLKISLSITQDQAPAPASSAAAIASPLPGRFRIIAQPLSASFQNQFNYDAQAATQVNLTLVPVPAPKSGDQVNSPPLMTPAAVLAAALASGAPFVTTQNAQGATVDAQGNVYTMATNFNATARTWYVLQYAPSNAAIAPVVVAVDDATQSVRIVTNS
jgi:hypothetical protein